MTRYFADKKDRLKELRMSQSLSQSEVAKKLRISPSIVLGYETGDRTPSTENLLALSYLYKCSTDYLLGKSNEQSPVILDTDGLNKKQIKVLQDLIKVMKYE